nr:helix-turn-helix transcriptional regulator [Clostridioides sp.]
MNIEKVKEIRNKQKRSQAYVAYNLNMSVSNYVFIENKKHRLKLMELIRLSRLLGKEILDCTDPKIFDFSLIESYTDDDVQDIIINMIKYKRKLYKFTNKAFSKKVAITESSYSRKENFLSPLFIPEVENIFKELDIKSITLHQIEELEGISLLSSYQLNVLK